MTTSDQELTIAQLEEMAGRASRARDKSGWVIAVGGWGPIVQALLASQKALREIADFVMDSRTRGYDNDPRIADMAEAALLRLGEGENSDAS